ncbi:MAG: ISNCY family transposase [Actinobacteria bacterium]|nr:ISNCY family transposase [Actinomycetota bacterium]
MDARAQQRVIVLTHVIAGELTLDEAAAYLHLSARQVRRLVDAFRGQGPAALVHGNRGRTPVNLTAEATRRRIVELAQTTYTGFNPVHLAEALAEDEAIEVSARTVRRILAFAGIGLPRTRRPPRHRSRRERMPRAGMLLQTDGSPHDWLEGRGPRLTLIAGVDDATSEISGGTFRLAEDAAGYFAMLIETVRNHGVPEALYTDLHGIFVKDPNRPPTLAEQLAGKRSLTQVGRALDAVGIRWIGARSAPAKGRVERGWGTHQDRLRSELRRAHVTTLDEANELFAWYVARHNRRFGVPAADPTPAWQAWSSRLPPEAVFCFEYQRRVERDATVAWDGGALRLPARPGEVGWAGRRVVVQERLDGSLWVRDELELYPLSPAPPSAPLLRARKLTRLSELAPSPEPVQTDQSDRIPSAAAVHRPGRDHPWRRYPAVRRR